MSDPRVIGEMPKNSREVLRVSLGRFKDHNTFDARVWANREGEPIPTKSGITARIELLPALVKLLTAAEAQARAEGLIRDSEGGAA
jgi:hypothetical protein